MRVSVVMVTWCTICQPGDHFITYLPRLTSHITTPSQLLPNAASPFTQHQVGSDVLVGCVVPELSGISKYNVKVE
ncbi:hypothetical protein Pcinc_023889 [Petrolisthes cinctipes]|uniref:Uncharacterized protein n=1 Tax=Petrolisthes cinctipes TaxID=88211 RepID=A0AAE1FE28_PETCI|nr:hypothetical protein Pcinc_023889 [Petrolisthes cinctipes]